MKAIYLAAALALSGYAMSPAAAAPAAPMQTLAVKSPLVLAQGYYYREDRRRRPRYTPGRRYRSAPHGWHRYDRRPGDWRHRGCVLVGPIWFCP